MVYIVDHEQMAVVEFSKTAERVGRLLNTMVAQRGLRNFGVRLGSDNKSEGNRKYAVPTISPAQVTPEMLTAARNF
jgi:hypothetical protein